tara:strand:- start:63 stop:518 length:456 start_codon:yes stop_codon:yes gene_type:complete
MALTRVIGDGIGQVTDIKLGGSGSANTLNDYEEGTWTPTLSGFAGTPTFANSTYVKVGDLVCLSVQVTLDGTSDGSHYRIESLPFTAFNTTNSVFGGFVTYTNSTYTSNIYVLVTSNDQRITLYSSSGNTVAYNDIGASKVLRITVIYRTA